MVALLSGMAGELDTGECELDPGNCPTNFCQCDLLLLIKNIFFSVSQVWENVKACELLSYW